MGLTTLQAATDRFADVLAAVTPERYGDSTPCEEWTVLKLIDHVIGGNYWAGLLLAGADGREALAQIKTMTFSNDRRESVADAAKAQLEAFAAAAPDATVKHVMGQFSVAQFLAMRTGDVVVHTWDLCRAIGADERIPPELVAAGLAVFESQRDRIGTIGVFGNGPEGAPEPDDDQQRLLHLTGRRP